MNRLLVTAAALLAALNTLGQGTIYYAGVSFNSVGSGNYVLDPSGARAAGTAYSVALYWGPANTTDDANLTQIGVSAAMLTGFNVGYFLGLGRTITYPDTVASVNGAVLAFQVRGWETRGGSLLSWEQALAAGAGVGRSGIFTVDTADPTLLHMSPDIGFAPGFAGGFQIVPEPSVYALGALGVAALLILRRRK